MKLKPLKENRSNQKQFSNLLEKIILFSENNDICINISILSNYELVNNFNF